MDKSGIVMVQDGFIPAFLILTLTYYFCYVVLYYHKHVSYLAYYRKICFYCIKSVEDFMQHLENIRTEINNFWTQGEDDLVWWFGPATFTKQT